MERGRRRWGLLEYVIGIEEFEMVYDYLDEQLSGLSLSAYLILAPSHPFHHRDNWMTPVSEENIFLQFCPFLARLVCESYSIKT